MIGITSTMARSEIVGIFMSWLGQRNPGEKEFNQALYEVGISVNSISNVARMKRSAIRGDAQAPGGSL
jgi:hypothetical protein